MALTTFEPALAGPVPVATGAVRRLRVVHFCPWAGRLQDGREFLRALPEADLKPRVSNPADPALLRMARLDCDWHGENVRAFGAMQHEGLEFLPIQAVGIPGMLDLLAAPAAGEERWFVISGQHPQLLGDSAERMFAALARKGLRILYYAFDEASRTMPCFNAIASHLSVLIHDELPLAPAAKLALPAGTRTIHRSWVANLEPGAAPFVERPEPKIFFLGSKLGLSPHRKRQIDFLNRRYGRRFVASCDHSLPVARRLELGRYQVGFCPEGRKFATEAMAAAHTDRPFWSGCLGMVPVCENSRAGGRLEELHRAGLIWRYDHADLDSLADTCDRALEVTADERRQIYEHFNREETVGAVVAAALHAAGAPAQA